MCAVQKQQPVQSNRSTSNRSQANPYADIDTDDSGDSWSLLEIDAGDLQLLLAACIAAGDAVMFSASKKGPLVGLTVYHNGEPTKKWGNSAEQFAELVSKFTRLALAQLPPEIAQRLTTSL
jgi:hypothetical protein